MVKQLFLVLAAAICIASANPTTDVNCYSGRPIKKSSVDLNVNEGHRLQQLGQTVPAGGRSRATYPHLYGGGDGLGIATDCNWPLYEFPLIRGDKPFRSGDNSGQDRVVFDTQGIYCASITHTNAPIAGGFVRCAKA
ncbi:hypothetical protein CERSUDRAFT_97715 [Gelatoporia subvermispora B]|uniref:Uncharacterized protein n=1 Tax=Ceriporiopsis subvermispora (strain B) TaxID=914234 RepID=M2QBW5_CERS8|nr:hypothetical protein CERSUDRAFT_97715 [Gelatoporia subvermispora B]